jgi:hypothetical protein
MITNNPKINILKSKIYKEKEILQKNKYANIQEKDELNELKNFIFIMGPKSGQKGLLIIIIYIRMGGENE